MIAVVFSFQVAVRRSRSGGRERERREGVGEGEEWGRGRGQEEWQRGFAASSIAAAATCPRQARICVGGYVPHPIAGRGARGCGGVDEGDVAGESRDAAWGIGW